MTNKEKIANILGQDAYIQGAFSFDDNKLRLCFTPDELNKIVEELETLLKEREKEILNKIPKGYTKKIKIGESDYACKQLKCTMKDIKEHNIESEGFDLGYKTAIDDIQKWKTEYLQSNNLEGEV